MMQSVIVHLSGLHSSNACRDFAVVAAHVRGCIARRHCVCAATAARNHSQTLQSTTRRSMLGLAAAVWALQHASSAAAIQNPMIAPSIVPQLPDGLTPYSADDFFFGVPEGYSYLEDQPDPSQAAKPRSTLDGEVQKPIRARFISGDGNRVITVLARESSLIKPTFVQLNDISQYGSLTDVALLLLPKGCRILSALSKTVEQPPRDTGTVVGTVQPPPITVYRYEILLNNGLHVAVAVAGIKGKVYLLGASAPDGEQWQQAAAQLRAAADSFMLLPRYNVIY